MVQCLQRGTLVGVDDCVRGVVLATRSTVLARRLVRCSACSVAGLWALRGVVLVTRSTVLARRLAWCIAYSVARLRALAIAGAA